MRVEADRPAAGGEGGDLAPGGDRKAVRPQTSTSARAAERPVLRRILHEDQIFRIDHFLGKDTVQSIMAFRFGNGLFEPIWNRDRIDHVQITAAETVGVETRGKFYEATGALRDMLPNHLLTLLSMVAMEPPVGFDAANIRSKKAEVLAAIPAVKPGIAPCAANMARARCWASRQSLIGRSRMSRRDSNVETYVAMRLEDRQLALGRRAVLPAHRQAPVAARDRDRHPFQAGALPPFQRHARRRAATQLAAAAHRARRGNFAAIRDQAAGPGDGPRLGEDGFSLQTTGSRKEANVGYETLIYDVMIGDQTLFMRADMVEQTWRIVQPVLDAWADGATADMPAYPSGGAGPSEAAALLARDGRSMAAYRRRRAPESRHDRTAATCRDKNFRPGLRRRRLPGRRR